MKEPDVSVLLLTGLLACFLSGKLIVKESE